MIICQDASYDMSNIATVSAEGHDGQGLDSALE
jgi:hypothetical protein